MKELFPNRSWIRKKYPLILIITFLLISGYSYGWVDISFEAESNNDFQFQNKTADLGLNYTATSGPLVNGNSGVYIADVNNDGWPDILTLGGDNPVLFENRGGCFNRAPVLPDLNLTMQGALFFDYNNDGWVDLLLLPLHHRPVFLKNTGGEFKTQNLGLRKPLHVPVGATAADYNHDGKIDVFVIQYGNWNKRRPAAYLTARTLIQEDNGYPNYLYEHTSGGFNRVELSGSGNHWSLAASFTDFTGDGTPDIHVANDFWNDTIYINQGNETFRQVELGSATTRNGMSSEITDINGDGSTDIFVTNIFLPDNATVGLSDKQYQRLQFAAGFLMESGRTKGNTLLLNQGAGRFTDRAQKYGVRKGGWGWEAAFEDFDNDGDDDLIQTTQLVNRKLMPRQYRFPMVWERIDSGFKPQNASRIGLKETNGRGMATLDYDRDGDMDVVIATYNGAFTVYENKQKVGNSIEIVISSSRKDRTHRGAKVYVTTRNETQTAVLNAMAGYMSQDSPLLHFGIGEENTIQRIRLVWPSGMEKTFQDIKANQRIVVNRNGIIETTSYSVAKANESC